MEEKKKEYETVFEVSEEQLEQIRAQARENARRVKHEWKQRGSEVICESCEFPHGITIGTGKIMIGIEGNIPKFVDRDLYMQKLREITF